MLLFICFFLLLHIPYYKSIRFPAILLLLLAIIPESVCLCLAVPFFHHISITVLSNSLKLELKLLLILPSRSFHNLFLSKGFLGVIHFPCIRATQWFTLKDFYVFLTISLISPNLTIIYLLLMDEIHLWLIKSPFLSSASFTVTFMVPENSRILFPSLLLPPKP